MANTVQVGAEPPHATVVLPTHGRRRSLLRVLRALAQQDADAGSFEVVVICDGDVDGSAKACRALDPHLPYAMRVVEQHNQGPAAARNRGVEAARAPLIIFIDDDVVPDTGVIAIHLEAHRGHDRRITIGPLLPPPDTRLNAWGEWEERVLCRQYADMIAGRFSPTWRQFYTGNAAVLKRHVLEAGGFDPSYRRAEDVELAQRLSERGLEFVFVPRARGWHYVRRSFASWHAIPAAYGSADVSMARATNPRMLAIVAEQYRLRHGAVRVLSHLCIGRPALLRPADGLFSALARLANTSGMTPLGTLSCSLLFNLNYYQSVASSLGGRDVFRRLLSGGEAADLLRYTADDAS